MPGWPTNRTFMKTFASAPKNTVIDKQPLLVCLEKVIRRENIDKIIMAFAKVL